MVIARATTTPYHPAPVPRNLLTPPLPFDVPAPARDDALRQQAWRDLLHAHARLVRAIDEELAAAGLLSMEVYDVLLALKRAPGRRLRLSDLAERVVLSRSGLTRLVDRVEAAGLLRRAPSPEDRRGSYAVLTPAGDAAMKRTWARYEGMILRHFGRHISGDEAAILHRIFSRMLPPDESTPLPVTLTISGAKRRRGAT